jgi:site-specific DNA recombinase
MEHTKHPVRRCAVYTRKSSEEGLEQDFNSLHVQREACEAFIRSQAGEGWRLSKTHYDDDGLSGGRASGTATAAGKHRAGVGRCSSSVQGRSADPLIGRLRQMVEIFDANGVSFVAVIQQFNTTTSTGRL